MLKRIMIQVRRHVHHCHVMFSNFEVRDQFSSNVASRNWSRQSILVRVWRGRWRIILQSGATHLLTPLDMVDIGGHSTNTFSIMQGLRKSKIMGSNSAKSPLEICRSGVSPNHTEDGLKEDGKLQVPCFIKLCMVAGFNNTRI